MMTPRHALRVLLVGLGTSVVPLDTAVNIAFPDITASFGLQIEAIQWVVICYVLTYASLMLAFGRVGDIFSYGRVFRIGLLFSSAAYLLCGIAPSFGWLLFCRFLQGIAAALFRSRSVARRGSGPALGMAGRFLVSGSNCIDGARLPRGAALGVSLGRARAGRHCRLHLARARHQHASAHP
jgi:MFS family permease